MSTTPDQAADAMLLALTEVIKGATSPEIQQAQAMLLRRLAEQGDVIPSRLPAPKNVTEVGGWFNLLSTLGETTMRRDMVASALGLAATPPGVTQHATPPLALTSLVNDRTSPDMTLTVTVRSDLAATLATARADVHAAGGMLPLWSPPAALPAATGATGAPPDPLPYLGREVWIAPTAALVAPETDPVVVARLAADPPGYTVGIRVSDGTAGAVKGAWSALVYDEIGQAFVERAIGELSVLPLPAVLAPTPFTATRLGAPPVSRGDYGWARLVATAGLVPGASTLGEELGLVWTGDQIGASVYAGHVLAVWDGHAFVG